MRRFRMALVGLAAAAGLLIPAAAASAATPTPTHAVATTQAGSVSTSSCVSTWKATATPPTGAHGEWTSNGCDLQGRIHIKCEFSNGSTHDYNGGWVRSVDFNDAKSCPSGSFLIRAAWQSRTGPGGAVLTQWFYPSS